MNAKAGYHHGDLRRALLDEALVVVREQGIEGLSLREVANRVGVSHAAPYHHFSSKSDLIHALAHIGMAEMDRAMARAASDAGDDPRDRLMAIGVAYVLFAVEHPDYYAAFSSPELAAIPADAEQPPEETADLWKRLIDAVVACQDAGELPAGDPLVLGVYLWSLVHGLTELWRIGPLRQLPGAEAGIEPLARQVVAAALGTADNAEGEGSASAGQAWSPCDETEEEPQP